MEDDNGQGIGPEDISPASLGGREDVPVPPSLKQPASRPTQSILTKNKRKVVKDLITKRPSEVAAKWGVNPVSISKFKARDDIKDMIRRERERMAEHTPAVVDFYRKVVDRADELLEADRAGLRGKELRAIDAKLIGEGIKAGQTIGQAVGLFPSHMVSNTNLFIADSPSLSPILASLLSHAVPAIDVTPPVPVEQDIPPGEGER